MGSMGFTGIIEEMGTVVKLCNVPDLVLWDGSTGEGVTLELRCTVALGDVYEGASIAVNGTCLTVTSFQKDTDEPSCTAGTFMVNMAPETLRCTNLGQLTEGSPVNLERAIAANGRNSGHNVQGHVDSTGKITAFEREGESLWVTIEAPDDVLRYIVPKGYIAVDGTSLTVCQVDRAAGWFNLMLIAHTQTKIVLPQRKVGDLVNLEVDVLAKYSDSSVQQLTARIEHLEALNGVAPAAAPAAAPEAAPAADAIDRIRRRVHGTATTAESTTTDAAKPTVAINKQLPATKHGAGLEVPLPCPEEAKGMKVAIVHTCWHSELVMLMVDKCAAQLQERGVLASNICTALAPGSYELPFIAQRVIDETDVDVVICIGILLKGGTIHMEVIANAVTNQLMSMQMAARVPIVFGVLTVLAIEQAQERAESELAGSWADSALTMALHKRKPHLKPYGPKPGN